MVTTTLKLKQLISWHVIYEFLRDGTVMVYYYPNANTQLKILLDQESVDLLKQKREQIAAFLEQEITLSGTVQERWEKKQISRTEDVEEWVRVQ